MNKPYLLIAGDDFYPQVGTGNWKECFATQKDAEKEGKRLCDKTLEDCCEWYEVVDLRDWQ